LGDAPRRKLPGKRRLAMSNIDTVKGIYEAFGRGDVPAILEQMSPDVDWDYPQTADVPWLKPRRGREGVGAFFRAAGEALEFRAFVPKEIFASPDGKIVVALVDVEAIVKATGRAFREEDEIHLWRFGSDGRVARFRHGVDTAKHLAALRPSSIAG
jgi:ketosteroid isomerase-like protein